MSIVSKVGGSTSPSFPAKQIEDCIRDALEDQAETQSILRGDPSDVGPTQDGWEPEIDSLVVVEIICSIEELLGTSLPKSFIPRGGYNSVDDCISDLVAQAEKVWSSTIKQPAYA